MVAQRLEEVPEANMLPLSELVNGRHYILPKPVSDPAGLVLGQTVLHARDGRVATCRFHRSEYGETLLEDLSDCGATVTLMDSEVRPRGCFWSAPPG